MFRFGHATHPDWREALDLTLLQMEGQRQLEQFASDITRTLKVGLVYVTEAYASHVDDILSNLERKTGVKQWAGAVAPGVCGSGAEYFQEPAMAAMILELPPDSAQVFSGKSPLPRKGAVNAAGRNWLSKVMVHADPLTAGIDDLMEDLSIKIEGGDIFGGLVSAGAEVAHIANGGFSGGVSGLVFSESVVIDCRLTQGVDVVGAEHIITSIRGNFIETLNDKPALDVLLGDLGILVEDGDDQVSASDLLAKRFSNGLFVGLTQRSLADTLDMVKFSGVRRAAHQFKVRPVVGIDVERKSLAVAESFNVGDRLSFCTRDEMSARTDLIRMCAELREELDAPAPKISEFQSAGFAGISGRKRPRGAVYVVCNGRGGALFGEQGAELQLMRQQLGDIPLIGYFANGEVYKGDLYGYTGVLILFF